jgi:Zn finger protein HypA/HybF involved in hydrogenase expression
MTNKSSIEYMKENPYKNVLTRKRDGLNYTYDYDETPRVAVNNKWEKTEENFNKGDKWSFPFIEREIICKYCDDYEKSHEERTEDDLLELWINKQRKSLEVHYCSKYTVLDYEDLKIKYCPMCGRKL